MGLLATQSHLEHIEYLWPQYATHGAIQHTKGVNRPLPTKVDPNHFGTMLEKALGGCPPIFSQFEDSHGWTLGMFIRKSEADREADSLQNRPVPNFGRVRFEVFGTSGQSFGDPPKSLFLWVLVLQHEVGS